ncbi:MAG: type II secretion system F family protein [Kiritimatiellae bacterium]|nr:type II secretion system F family protein [Kiritimatiellia bacterium]
MATSTYNVIARDGRGESIVRSLTADSEMQARQLAEDQGLRVLAIVRERQSAAVNLWRRILFGKFSMRFGVTTDELAMFCDIFKALHQSGVPVLQILELVAEETPNSFFRNRLWVVHRHLLDGAPLSEAMADSRCRKAFPKLMRATIATGEQNGRLDVSLNRLSEIYKRASETRRETISALIYPMLALIVFFVVCGVIAYMVPPALEEAVGKDQIKKVRDSLPVAIRILFFFRDNPLFLALPPAIMAGLGMLWALGKRFAATRLMLTHVERRIPVFGRILFHFSLVRMIETLSTNHETGIQVAESLQLVEESVNDAVFEEALKRVRNSIVTAGTSLAAGMEQERCMPGLLIQMIRSGEISGRLAEMLSPIAIYYRESAKAMLKRALDMITPGMIILLGSVIGPVVIGVYKTIFILQMASAGESGAL